MEKNGQKRQKRHNLDITPNIIEFCPWDKTWTKTTKHFVPWTKPGQKRHKVMSPPAT
jgi:hypothetical protein